MEDVYIDHHMVKTDDALWHARYKDQRMPAV